MGGGAALGVATVGQHLARELAEELRRFGREKVLGHTIADREKIALVRWGGGLGIGSIALMLLGTQWYILFNVIAGATAIPSDLKEVARLFHFSQWQRWKVVILPGIFPYLVTGLVTASGGAWNASIIAEYFHLKDRTLQTLGLGAQISAASDHGQFSILLLATIIMSLMVVTVNRLVWRPMYRLAETKFRLDT